MDFSDKNLGRFNKDQSAFVERKLESIIHKFGGLKFTEVTRPTETPDSVPFDSNNYDMLYHDVYTFTPWDPDTTYMTYEPYGKYRYGGQSYVPTYEDSIFLSKSHGVFKSQFKQSNNSMLRRPKVKRSFRHDFCSNPGYTKDDIDYICNQLPQDVCLDTSCCVSMGGSHCMAGDKQGPWLSYYYDDPFHQNKDYYYYMNKCYGNCDAHL